MGGGQKRGLTRRDVLRGSGGAALAFFMAAGPGAPAGIAIAAGPGGGFLDADELETLRALVDRFIPGKPEAPEDGALAAGCAEAIDALLNAFASSPPLIYAGAPFSDRAGSPVNHFEEFLPLDPYEEKAWRLRIEGSAGRPDLEFNGPVRGLQAVVREGLAALEASRPGGFAGQPGPVRDVILRSSNDAAVSALIDAAFPLTLQFMYGAPEYGGNKDLVGWEYTNYDGDVQPRGWTAQQVTQPDPAGLTELLPQLPVTIPLEDLLALAPLASPEVAHGIVARSGDSLAALKAEVADAVQHAKERRRGR